ncbi:MAG: ethanolamine ammonia-lyase reactivating factor EutA [Pirellulaceae bacterium]|nr:ethanolamine ammonia-lyase reactivating factor EutA [Pirellulaceae bacterium]
MALYPPPTTCSNDNQVFLLGLDFGTTTSSAIVARANVSSHGVTGRMHFGNPQIIFRSDPVFTPFVQDRIDEQQLQAQLDAWLDASGILAKQVFAGACMITGLAAKTTNANQLARLIQRQIGESLTATAGDPSLESWLAFMGNCSTLSRHHSDLTIINLDIGGGTTNPAIGINGEVLGTASYFIGARHFEFIPGTYRLRQVSQHGGQLLRHLGFDVSLGEQLDEQQVNRILDFYVTGLEAIATGCQESLNSPDGRLVEQVPWNLPPVSEDCAVTFSGGVGELIYRHRAGESLPETTHFGDLGIDLAKRIVASSRLSRNLSSLIPENLGRATVFGLTLHSTELSGTTLYLPDPTTLPLRDLPVIACLRMDATADDINRVLSLAVKNAQGACIQLVNNDLRSPKLAENGLSRLKQMGERLAKGMLKQDFQPAQPLVILTPDNQGHAIGNYATQWRKLPINLIVIDEVPTRDAQFVNIGRARQNVIPISFYGLR